MKIFLFVLLCIISAQAFSKYPYESLQHIMNRIVENSDTIFVGKILQKKEIERGLIVGSRSKNIGILEVEIIKKYRGNIKNKEKRLVCTWIDDAEHVFNFNVGQELMFFGINTGLTIQLPSTYGYIMEPMETEKALFKALKNKRQKTTDTKPFFETVHSGDTINKNACNEAVNW